MTPTQDIRDLFDQGHAKMTLKTFIAATPKRGQAGGSPFIILLILVAD